VNLTPFLPRTRRPSLQAFVFPLAIPVKIAALQAEFRESATLRNFSLADTKGLHGWAPEALVLPLSTALTLAHRKLPSLSTAIVALTSFAETPVDAQHRDCLWRAFGVPVFEQLTDWSGLVLARECEVHDGLHIDRRCAGFRVEQKQLIHAGRRTGLSATIATAHCECGAETPRLRDLVRLGGSLADVDRARNRSLAVPAR
jgi:hypothetical protein